jgi:hypothetical protein
VPKSPTEKALRLLEAYRWEPEIVERWDSFAKVRKDLMGFADLLAFNPRVGCSTLALQVTSEDNVAARVKKLMSDEKVAPKVLRSLRCGWRVEVWGMRTSPVNGSGIKARTLLLNEDGTVRVVDGSLALEQSAEL